MVYEVFVSFLERKKCVENVWQEFLHIIEYMGWKMTIEICLKVEPQF